MSTPVERSVVVMADLRSEVTQMQSLARQIEATAARLLAAIGEAEEEGGTDADTEG